MAIPQCKWIGEGYVDFRRSKICACGFALPDFQFELYGDNLDKHLAFLRANYPEFVAAEAEFEQLSALKNYPKNKQLWQ